MLCTWVACLELLNCFGFNNSAGLASCYTNSHVGKAIRGALCVLCLQLSLGSCNNNAALAFHCTNLQLQLQA